MGKIVYKALKQDENGYYSDGFGNGKKTYWEIGDRKKLNGTLELCKNGYHFFRHICLAIDYLEIGNAIFEFEVHGRIETDTFDCCTNDIECIRKLDINEETFDQLNNTGDFNGGNFNAGCYNAGWFNVGDRNIGNHNYGNKNSGNFNVGSNNTGSYNIGDRNSGTNNAGYFNTGNFNTGDRNAGYKNTGNFNTGDFNCGYRNSGSDNSGHKNSGNFNSGNCNSGDYNAGNFNSGNGYHNYFCRETKYFLFDIEVKKIPEKLKNLFLPWFDPNGCTYKDAWLNCPKEILDILRSIPEFKTDNAKEIFKEITGLEL